MKKFFSLVLALVMALSLTTMAWGATVTVGTGGTYATMQEAVDAAGSGDTVVLKSNVNGNGVKIDKNLTIDLGGFTYTIDGNTVGDRHTNTLGMQILKDNTVTIMNGTIVGSDDADRPAMLGCPTSCAYCNGEADYGVKMVIQNYANLTLDGVTVTGNSKAGYVVSNNCGDVVIEDTTINAAAGNVAFDVCDFQSYTGVSVTVKGNSVINGKIELSDDNTGDSDVTKLVIENGTINGAIDVATSGMTEDVTISGGTFSVLPDEDYLADGFTFVGNTVSVPNDKATTYDGLYAKSTALTAADPTTLVDIIITPAKAPKYNKTTGYVEAPGIVEHVNITGDGTNYVFVNSLADADVVLYKDADGKQPKFYLDAIGEPEYYEAALFTNFGEKCGQVDYEDYDKTLKYFTIKGAPGFYVFEEVEVGFGDGYVMYAGKLVPVTQVADEKVPHTAIYTTKNGVVESIECGACGLKAVKVPNALSMAKDADVVDGETLWYWPAATVVTPSTDKNVTSADTFDAGIAMYVGMSVMAAAGGAVVIGKKKD